MKNKNLVKNVVYLILISIFFIGGLQLLTNHLLHAAATFRYNVVYFNLIILLFFGGIGVLLGLSTKNFPVKDIRIVKVNKSKLLLLGLPSLIVATNYIWLQVINNILSEFNYLFNVLYKLSLINLYSRLSTSILIVASIILGHTIITSIDMEESLRRFSK